MINLNRITQLMLKRRCDECGNRVYWQWRAPWTRAGTWDCYFCDFPILPLLSDFVVSGVHLELEMAIKCIAADLDRRFGSRYADNIRVRLR